MGYSAPWPPLPALDPTAPPELARRMGLWGVDRLKRKTQDHYRVLHDSPLSYKAKLETYEIMLGVYCSWAVKTLPGEVEVLHVLIDPGLGALAGAIQAAPPSAPELRYAMVRQHVFACVAWDVTHDDLLKRAGVANWDLPLCLSGFIVGGDLNAIARVGLKPWILRQRPLPIRPWPLSANRPCTVLL